MTFKKILDGQLKRNVMPVQSNTIKRIDKMDKIAKEIDPLRNMIEFIANPRADEKEVDREKLQSHLKRILNERLPNSAASVLLGEEF